MNTKTGALIRIFRRCERAFLESTPGGCKGWKRDPEKQQHAIAGMQLARKMYYQITGKIVDREK